MIRIINFDGVSYSKEGKVILDNLNFSIEKGSFVSIIGGNGSGKSSLVGVLAGINKYSGYINVDGYFLSDDYIHEIRKKVSVVLDDVSNMMIGATVCDEISLKLNNLGMDEFEIGKRVLEFARLFKIEDILNKGIDSITNSERQKINVVVALINYPDVVVLDDCLHQLSVSDKKIVFEVLNRYKKEKKMTVIMVTHDMEDVIGSDRVIVLNCGKVVMDGSVIRVFKKRDKLFSLGIRVPFVIDLSLRLMDKGIVNHVYLDMRKLVDGIWK